MANNQIGVSFMPSAEQSAMGGRQGSLEGVPEQAFKILSLRLPRVLGSRSLSPSSLMTGPGSAGVGGGGLNPLSAVFTAILRGMGVNPGGGGMPGGGMPGVGLPTPTTPPVNYPGGSPTRLPRSMYPNEGPMMTPPVNGTNPVTTGPKPIMPTTGVFKKKPVSSTGGGSSKPNPLITPGGGGGATYTGPTEIPISGIKPRPGKTLY